MPHLHAARLLAAPTVELHRVTCSAPRSGAGTDETDEPASRAQILVPLRGVFAVHRRGDVVVADAATAVVFGGGDVYRVSHPAHGGDVTLVLTVPPALLEDAVGGSPGLHGLISRKTQMHAHILAAGRPSEEAALGLIAALGRDLAGAPPADALQPFQRRRVERVRAAIAADPGRRWRLADVAHEAGVSPFHLARQFRAGTDETIARYVMRMRLARAISRLAEGEDDLARLAAELGFAHHSHFTRCFREAFGVTPSEGRTIVTAPSKPRV